MDSRIILMFSATGALLLLIWHCFRKRGWLTTLMFFPLAFLFALRKEMGDEPVRNFYYHLLYALDFAHVKEVEEVPSVVYFLPETAVTLFGVALILPVGWVFTWYVSWSLAEDILENWFPSRHGEVFPTLSMMIIIVASIALCMETTGTNVGWWTWNYKAMLVHHRIFWQGTFIWPMPTLIFMMPFLLFGMSTNIPVVGRRIYLRVPFGVLMWGVLSLLVVVLVVPTCIPNPLLLNITPLCMLLFWFIHQPRFTDSGDRYRR